jgi:bacteriocin-like protein
MQEMIRTCLKKSWFLIIKISKFFVMKKLSKDEMKKVIGGVEQRQVITGWTANGTTCTVDLCWIDTTTGAATSCSCDIPTACAPWMYN